MPADFRVRRDIVEVGRRIWQRGYVAASDGNLSVRLPDGRILVTPTGRSKGFLEPDDLVIVDAAGRRVSGSLKPTSELPMHLFVYESRPDVSAVVHAHPPSATGFAVAGVHLAQCVLPEVILTLGGVPLTQYATPSTPEVPASIEEYIRGYNAILLRSHGALTLGKDIFEAYFRMETVEHFARITLAAKALGGASPIPREEVQKLLKVREALGVAAPSGGCVNCGACETAEHGEVRAGSPDDDIVDSVKAGSPDDDIVDSVKAGPPDDDVVDAVKAGPPDDDIVNAVLARLRASMSAPGTPSGQDGESN